MAKNKSTLPMGPMKISGTIAGKSYPEKILRARVIHDHWSVMGKERWEGVSSKEKTEISRKGAMSRAAAARDAKVEAAKAKPKAKSKPKTVPAAKKPPTRKALTPIERMVDEATGYEPEQEESWPEGEEQPVA